MAEYPILFKGPMVNAIFEQRKTMTRRYINPQPEMGPYGTMVCLGGRDWDVLYGDQERPWKCPYGTAGDTLWVRETWGIGTRPDPYEGWRDGIEYQADCDLLEEGDILSLYPVTPPDDIDLDSYRPGWHPSIHMPRWACRLLLDVQGVRVERLQDISTEDCIAEGISCPWYCPWSETVGYPGRSLIAKRKFAQLWDSINGKKPGRTWTDNPWVWAIAFRHDEEKP